MTEETIFTQALEKEDPTERAAFLDRTCGGDAKLRLAVEALLKSHEHGSFLGSPVVGLASPPRGRGTGGEGATPTLDDPNTERPGAVIGPYKLLQQIGEGGMGTVFMAEQTRPVLRKVAIKVIKPGMDSRQVIARFEAERQALAMMDHVNIARVLDAGTTRGEPGGVSCGRPYFVMELVHGVPITKYCDDNRLTPRERLELFVPVCQAIQHAHQKGIIHRDIKPSNVMVTLYDGKPVPKVIDFGVAKATEQKLTERTLFTQYGTMVGTLEYMSPEQAEMSALGIDTRSDIYSLGVLLYELLTGSTPLTHTRMKEGAYAEILRMIKEEEPPKPSTRLSDSGEALASISAQRKTEPAKLTKLVRGELDWIVMKCLEKDRNRRYETANGFAADIRRYLDDEPVRACPPTVAYRFRKFARRNKVAFMTAAVIAVAMVAGTTVSTWQAIRATQAEGLAETRLEGEQVARKDADDALEAEKRAKVALSAAKQLAEDRADKIGRDLEKLNAANAFIEGGRYHVQYDEWAKAERDFSAAVACRPDNSRVWTERAEFYLRMGLWDLAAADMAKAFELHPPRSPYEWNYHALLRLYVGDVTGYRRTCRQMAEQFADSANPQDCAAVARTCILVDDPAVDRAKLVQLAELGVAEQKTAWRLTNLGTALYRAGHYDKAVERLRESQVANPAWGKTLSHSILAMAHHRLEQPELARQSLAAAALALDERVRTMYQKPPGSLPTVWWDIVQSDLHYREAKTLIDGKPPPDDPRQAVIRGKALAALGHDQQALASFTHAIEVQPDFVPGWFHRGRTYARLGTWDKAKADYEKAGTLDPKNATMPVVHNNLAWLLCTCPDAKLHEPQRAVTLAKKAVDMKRTEGVYWNTLGVARCRAKDWPGAITALLKSIELREGGDSNDWFFLAMAQWRLDQKPNAQRWFTHAAHWMDKKKPADEELRRFRAEAADLLGVTETLAEAPASAWADKAALYTLVVATDPKALWAYEQRGMAYGMLAQYESAAADFARVVEAKPDDPYRWYQHAMAQLGADDLDGYHRVCAAMRERFGKTKDPVVAGWLLATCDILVEPGSETAELVSWSKLAAPHNDWARFLGHALYRDGQYDSAVRHLQEWAKTKALRGDDLFFLAMSQHQLGKENDARKTFGQAVTWIASAERVNAAGGVWYWHEQVEVRYLRSEAEKLLKPE